MSDFLQGILALPTVLYTIPLGLSLVYWLFVVIGAVDIDVLDGADGVLDGALDGAADGAIDGAADGVLDGAADGTADGALDGAAESAGGVAGLLNSLNLRSAPVTVVGSLILLFGWVGCYLLMRALGPLLPFVIAAALALVVSFVLALFITSLAVRPLAPIFETEQARSRAELIGQTCQVSTGRVDGRFGQAEWEDGGAGLIIQIRCDHSNELRRGAEALIVSYDAAREAFIVEPIQI